MEGLAPPAPSLPRARRNAGSPPRPQPESGLLHVPLSVPCPEPLTSGEGTEGEDLVLAYTELRSRVPARAVLKEKLHSKNEGCSAWPCVEGRLGCSSEGRNATLRER